jgi:hypothetical protein
MRWGIISSVLEGRRAREVKTEWMARSNLGIENASATSMRYCKLTDQFFYFLPPLATVEKTENVMS